MKYSFFKKCDKVWPANPDSTIGSEIKKTRPVVIIQNDMGNQHNSLTIAAPVIFGEKANCPVEIEI
jgi:mRNA-degrading endonuclease toxin of MazEF toxin-antitoxin module